MRRWSPTSATAAARAIYTRHMFLNEITRRRIGVV
jgi:hypothetical protein